MEFIFFGGGGGVVSAGTAGNGESSGFGMNRAPILSFRGGKAVGDNFGRAGGLRGIFQAVVRGAAAAGAAVGAAAAATVGEASFDSGGGAGRAFEKRERPPVPGGLRADVSMLITRGVGTEGGRSRCVTSESVSHATA